MHILMFPIGFFLWYKAYSSKPFVNDDVTFLWKKNNILKRVRLLNIIRDSGFPDLKLQKKIDFEKLYTQKLN